MANILYPVTSKYFQVDTGGTLTTSLQAYYKLEDPSDFWSTYPLSTNGTILYDTGKIINGADPGNPNSANGLYTNSNLGITSAVISISFWFKLVGTLSGYMQPIGHAQSTTHIFHELRYNGVSWVVERDNNGGSSFTIAITGISAGVWNHFVITDDGSTMQAWMNGASQGTVSVSGSGSGAVTDGIGICQGHDTANGNYFFIPGMLDEVGFWSKKLSNQEVSDLYNGGSGQTMVGNVSDADSDVDGSPVLNLITPEGPILYVNVVSAEPIIEEVHIDIPSFQPILSFRYATYPYDVLPSPFIYSETIANQGGLPILAGDNSDVQKFRVYNNFGLQQDISTAHNVSLTTYDSSAHTYSTPLVVQEWISLQENGYGANSTTANFFTSYKDTALFVGGPNNVKSFAVGADGTLGSNIAAGPIRDGCGFIEVNTYAKIPLGQATATTTAVLTASFDWST